LHMGQTDETVDIRLTLDPDALNRAMEKVPYYRLWGVDVSEKYLKVFIRGDESSPIVVGRLGGNCIPDQTLLHLSGEIQRPLEGHRVPGTMEVVSCLDVTLVKSEDSRYYWEKLLNSEGVDMNAPCGTLEEFQQNESKRRRDPSPDRCNWTPDDWADEQKIKADTAFKQGRYQDSLAYYARALKFTPRNHKLFLNRSAAHAKLGRYQAALEDAAQAQVIEPRWPKTYFRKGFALRAMKKWDEAIAAFEEGDCIDPKSMAWQDEIKKTRDSQKEFNLKQGNSDRK